MVLSTLTTPRLLIEKSTPSFIVISTQLSKYTDRVGKYSGSKNKSKTNINCELNLPKFYENNF